MNGKNINVDFSVIVPAYNEEGFIGKTLDSIIAAMKDVAGGFRGELIVVDNNSTDRTAEFAREKGAKIVFEKENCIAKARNTGARESSGRYMFFVDADTIISSELISAALKQLEDKKICGGGTSITFDIELPLFGKFFLWTWSTVVKFYPMAAGSFLFCRKDAWEQTGGFNETVYASEEIWFSRMLRKWGKKNGYKFILLDIPTVTSGRKFSWYSTTRIMLSFMFFAICPFAVRSKRLCSLWYDRK